MQLTKVVSLVENGVSTWHKGIQFYLKIDLCESYCDLHRSDYV